jgi:hypothetical protein
MSARLEKKLRLLAIIVMASMIGAAAYALTQGFTSAKEIAVGILYGLLISVTVASISLFVLEGPMRVWLGGLSFTANLIVRSAIYSAIIVPILFFQLGGVIAGVALDPSHKTFWIDIAYSVACVVLANLVLESPTSSGRAHSLISSSGDIIGRLRKAVSCYSSTSRDRRGWLSVSAGSPFTACSIARFACLPFQSSIIAAKSSIMSATR